MTNIFTSERFPTRIDLLKSADHGFVWSGNVPVSQFLRLYDAVLPESADNPVHVSCALTVDTRKIVWFEMSAQGVVQQTCFRCLQPVNVHFDEYAKFAILTDESFCERLNADDDFVILAEESLVHGVDKPTDVDLLAIIEDELLLALPRSARHEDCLPAVPEAVQQALQKADESSTDNPFDVLAQLKKH